MIVREVLNHPELLDKFDYFNDTDDTLGYLQWCIKSGNQPEDAHDRMTQLRAGRQNWLQKFREGKTHPLAPTIILP